MPSIDTPWFEVPKLKEQYGLIDFVETGCDKGVSLSHARSYGFRKLLSCDVNRENVVWARKSVPEAGILRSDSIGFLSQLQFEHPSLIFLDAHFSGLEGLEVPAYDWPLYEEMQILSKKKNIETCVILCDDLCQIHALDNPRYRPGECDWRGVHDRPLADYIALLPNHDVRVFLEDNGALLFTPKADSP